MTSAGNAVPPPPQPPRAHKGFLRGTDAFLSAGLPMLWPLLRIIIIVILALLTLIFTFFVPLVAVIGVNNFLAARELAAVRKVATDRGLALSMKEYLAALPDIPDSENAALIYLDAFEKLNSVGIDPETDCVPIVSRALARRDPADRKVRDARQVSLRIGRDARTPLTDYMLEDSIRYLADRAEVLALLHQAASLDQCQYPVDWQGFDAPPHAHLTSVHNSMLLLGVAAWVAAEEKRPADAASRIRDSLALTRSLKVMALGVEMELLSMTVTNLQRVVARTDLSPDDLLSLEVDFSNTLAAFSARPACEATLAFYLDLYEGFLSDSISMSAYTSEHTVRKPRLTERVLTFPDKAHLCRDEALAIRCLLRALDNIDSPSSDFLTGSDPVMAEINQSDYVICKEVAALLPDVVTRAEVTRARLRAVIAGLAALRYYSDHASWPPSLDDLVPGYLDALPVDPVTAKPLIYVIKDDGIIIYSVGANAIDDGEGYYAEPPEGTERTGDDVGFRIWK